MLKRIAILCLFFSLFGLPALVQADQEQPYFQTNFQTLSDWEHITIGVVSDPCQDSRGLTEWKMYEHGFGAEVLDGPPCFMAMIRPELPFGPEWMEVTWDSYFTDPNQDRNVVLHWKDNENYIGIYLHNNSVFLHGFFHGEELEISDSPSEYPFQANRTYSFRVRENRHTGDFLIWVNGVLVIDTNIVPARFISARPGIAVTVGEERTTSQSYFSNFTIWNSQQPLVLRPWKQNVEPWADLEYDSAKKWSPTAASIARWGCAMTSAAMILDSVGVKQLPSGELLNPGTLNAWLKSEPDGYLGPGFLNWRAIARLAKWHNHQYGSTSLEFHAVKPTEATQISWLREKLDQRTPVILEQPGHFIVATNWNKELQDIDILDPAYARSTLSMYDSKFISARVFTPSATNLQGATLLLPKWAVPALWTESGRLIELIPLESEPYDQAGSSQSEWQLWDAAAWGNERVRLSVSAPLPVPLLGTIYDENGTNFTVPAVIHPNVMTPLAISSESMTPEMLSDQTIAQFMSWGEIKTPSVWLWRQQIAAYSERTPTTNNSISGC